MLPFKYEFQDPGMRRAHHEGIAEGIAKGKAEDVVAVLEHRGLIVSDEARARILASKDLAQLQRWLFAAFTVPSVDALFPH